jgi:putative nucleotidyltransferase with HDIG domain
MLSGMAEHARELAGLTYVAIFRHAATSHTVLEELARASMLDVEEMERVRAAGHTAVRGMRRFARRTVMLEGGVYVVAAEMANGEVASVVAAGSEGDDVPAEMNAALVDLVQVAARVLSEPAAEAPVAPVAPEPIAQATQAAQPPRPGAGYGARVGDALAFLQRPPILAESRWRLTQAMDQRHAALSDAIEIVETDVGLATAVMSAANRLPGHRREGVASVPAALAVLGPRATLRLASALPTMEPAAPSGRLSMALARVSAHAVAARSAADVVARTVGERSREELRLAAVLHDVGKITLVALSNGYLAELSDHSATPEDRLANERRRFAIDHAAIGALTLRRLGLPQPIVALVDSHHSTDVLGRAAIVRLADMLAHLAYGDPVSAEALRSISRRLSLDQDALGAIAYDLQRSRGARTETQGPSPLTTMQEKALRGLADGKRYKQIAADLGLAESTVRSHVHNLYRKLDVADRAHAVLLASERGWI